MFERFTETARRIIRTAHEEAHRRHHRSVDPEHLLFAMLQQRDGIALAVLDRLGVQRGAVTDDLEGVLSSLGAAAEPVNEIPFGMPTKRALERAIEQARRLESRWVGTEHLLLGLLHDGHSQASRTLGAHGVNFQTTLATVSSLLGEPTEPGPRHPAHE